MPEEDSRVTARLSRSVEERREQAFLAWVESSKPYFDKVEAEGDTPWHGGSLEVRRELYMRRYTRPGPPAGLLTELAKIREPENRISTDVSDTARGAERRAERLSPTTPIDDTRPSEMDRFEAPSSAVCVTEETAA